MNIRNLAILVCTIVLYSCASTKVLKNSSSDDLLLNNKWQVIELSGNKIIKEINGNVPYLSFDKLTNHYSIITGCNTMNGALVLSKNDHIKFNNGMSTMMYCDDMSVEDGFKAILSKITNFRIEGNMLLLSDEGNNVIAKLEKMNLVTNYSLDNTSWELSFIAGSSDEFDIIFSDKKPSINFLEDGKVTGNASCNTFRTSFKVIGNSISFGESMSTKMMCPNLKGEQLFLETLSKVNKYSDNGKDLHLMIGDVVVLRFKKI